MQLNTHTLTPLPLPPHPLTPSPHNRFLPESQEHGEQSVTHPDVLVTSPHATRLCAVLQVEGKQVLSNGNVVAIELLWLPWDTAALRCVCMMVGIEYCVML